MFNFQPSFDGWILRFFINCCFDMYYFRKGFHCTTALGISMIYDMKGLAQRNDLALICCFKRWIEESPSPHWVDLAWLRFPWFSSFGRWRDRVDAAYKTDLSQRVSVGPRRRKRDSGRISILFFDALRLPQY